LPTPGGPSSSTFSWRDRNVRSNSELIWRRSDAAATVSV
jgi:hypothetical protein